MLVEKIIVNGLLIPQIVVSIIEYGAGLFRSISHHLFNDQEKFQEIQNVIFSHMTVCWNDILHMSYNSNIAIFLVTY